jgi:hypothetical protein
MRAKIIWPNLVAILLVGLVGFFFLKQNLTGRTVQRLQGRMTATAFLFERSEVLRGYELLFALRRHAASKSVLRAFDRIDIERGEGDGDEEFERRFRQAWFQAAYTAVETVSELCKEADGKQPDLLFLTDRKGVVIARNTTPKACPTGHNVSKAMAPVGRALEGEANYSLWSADDSPLAREPGPHKLCSLKNVGLLEIAAVPVVVRGEPAGALVIGYEVSNGTAVKQSAQVGLDLAVLKGGEVYSSSFTTDSARQGLGEAIRQVARERIDKALEAGRHSEIFDIEVEGRPYLAMAVPVANAETKDRIVSLVLASVEDFAADLDSLYFLLVLMGVAVILVVVAGVVLGNHFMRPVMAIEDGLLKIINGEYGHRFDIKSAEVGGLGYRINQLIGVLTGEDDDGDEGEGEGEQPPAEQ